MTTDDDAVLVKEADAFVCRNHESGATFLVCRLSDAITRLRERAEITEQERDEARRACDMWHRDLQDSNRQLTAANARAEELVKLVEAQSKKPKLSARDALLQLTDRSNWPEHLKGDLFFGYNEAMEAVHEVVMEFWPELSKKDLPEALAAAPAEARGEGSAETATLRD